MFVINKKMLFFAPTNNNKTMQNHTNFSFSKDAVTGINGGFASFLHPYKSIILEKSPVRFSGLHIQSRTCGIGNPLKRVNVAKMVLDGVQKSIRNQELRIREFQPFRWVHPDWQSLFAIFCQVALQLYLYTLYPYTFIPYTPIPKELQIKYHNKILI